MVFIYINSRLLQVMDTSREKTNAAGFAGMCVARCQGLGLFPSFFPRGLCQAPPATTSALAHGVDWPLILTKAARWQLGLSVPPS